MKRDLTLTTDFVFGIAPGSYASTQTGAAIDTTGFEYAIVVLEAGTFTGDESLDLKVQTSTASGSGFEDVTGASFVQITTANDVSLRYGVIRLDGVSRYIRLLGTQAGTGAAVYSALVLLLNGERSELADTAAFTV